MLETHSWLSGHFSFHHPWVCLNFDTSWLVAHITPWENWSNQQVTFNAHLLQYLIGDRRMICIDSKATEMQPLTSGPWPHCSPDQHNINSLMESYKKSGQFSIVNACIKGFSIFFLDILSKTCRPFVTEWFYHYITLVFSSFDVQCIQ